MNTANTQQIKKKNSKCEAMWSQSFFNDLVKSLDLKWGRSDADFHHIFLKERPRAPSLHSPKKLSENKRFLLLFPSFRCLMLGTWKPLIHHRSANFKTGVGNSGSPYRQSSPSFPDVKYCWQCFRFMDYRVLKRKLQSQKEIILGSRLSHGSVQGTALWEQL